MRILWLLSVGVGEMKILTVRTPVTSIGYLTLILPILGGREGGRGSNTMKGDVFNVAQSQLGLDYCFYVF